MLLVIIGLAAGLLGSIIGVGGGIIMSPALTFLGFSPAHAASTSLIAITSTSVSSTLSYSKFRKIAYNLGLKMAAFSIPGAILGAFISTDIPPVYFKSGFVVLLFFSAFYILFKRTIIENKLDYTSIWTRLFFYSSLLIAGFVSSLFGIGGGIVFVPLLVIVIGQSMSNAVPNSQFTLMITSVIGTLTHVLLGNPEYIQAFALALGSFAGAQFGSRISLKLSENTLRIILAVSFIGIGLKFIYDLAS